MLHQLLAWLPQHVDSRAFVIAWAVACVGLMLAVGGARFSRSIFTLMAVAGGAWAGMRVPRWVGWELDPMATGIGAGLVMGLVGFLLHRAWIGLTLGIMLATFGLAITWHRLLAIGAGSLPTIDLTQPLNVILREFWHGLPTNWSRILMIVAGTGLAAGAMLSWVWPKVARVLAFSMLGCVMLAGGGLVAVAIKRPDWLAHVPPGAQTQGMLLALMFVASALVQWSMLPRVKRSDAPLVRPPANRPGPRDVRDLGSTALGPMPKKEAA
jgi:hypothetical protein